MNEFLSSAIQFFSWHEEGTFVLLGAVLGVALSAVWTEYRDWRRMSRERQILRATLLNEVAAQAMWLNDHVETISLYAAGAGDIDLARLCRFRAPDPVIYKAVAPRIGLLGQDAATHVIAFYGNVDLLRLQLDERPGSQGLGIEEIAKRWRTACDKALPALYELEQVARLTKESREQLVHLREQLEKVGKGEP